MQHLMRYVYIYIWECMTMWRWHLSAWYFMLTTYNIESCTRSAIWFTSSSNVHHHIWLRFRLFTHYIHFTLVMWVHFLYGTFPFILVTRTTYSITTLWQLCNTIRIFFLLLFLRLEKCIVCIAYWCNCDPTFEWRITKCQQLNINFSISRNFSNGLRVFNKSQLFR